MEVYLFLVVFLLLAMATILLFGLDKNLSDSLKLAQEIRGKKRSMKKPKNTLSKQIARMQKRQKAMAVGAGMPLTTYRLMSMACVMAGFMAGKLIFNSIVLAVLIATLSAFIPMLYLTIKGTKNKGSRVEQLRSTMMILSSSYIVTEDFLKSVQDNIDLLEYPKPFRNFLVHANYIDGNLKVAFRRLEQEVDNTYFSQWIDVLMMAQDDRSLKYVTMSVVDAMNDAAQAQLEGNTAIAAVWREYFMVLALIFSAPLIFKLLMPFAYQILVTSMAGQSLMVLLLVAVVFSIWRALKLNKPIMI